MFFQIVPLQAVFLKFQIKDCGLRSKFETTLYIQGFWFYELALLKVALCLENRNKSCRDTDRLQRFYIPRYRKISGTE